MQIVFDLPHAFFKGANEAQNSQTLETLLESLIQLNLVFLFNQKRLGRTVKPLYQSGVVYGRTVWWDTIPALYRRGYGDCKSLTAAYVAERRFAGKEAKPVHRWIDNFTAIDYHILVQVPEPPGFHDPSRKLGMGANENSRLVTF